MKKNFKRNFAKNVILLMFSQAIIKILGLAYKLYITNKEGYGDVGNAIYAAAFQIYVLFLTICSAGIPNAISQLVSSKLAVGDNKGAYRIFKIAVAMFGSLGFLCSVVLYIHAGKFAINYLEMPKAKIPLEILAASIFAVSISAVLKGYFNGREQMKTTANAQSIEQVAKTILTIILVELIGYVSEENTIYMVCGAAIASTISTIINLSYLFKKFINIRRNVWSETMSSTINKQESIKTIIKSILKVVIPISIRYFAFCSK